MTEYDHCATEEYRVESPKSKKRCKRWPLVVVLIITIIILIAITLAVIYTRRSSESYYDIDRVSALSSIRIVNRNFTPELNESSSAEYIELETIFVLTMDDVFTSSDLASSYNATKVDGFRSGSVIVLFKIILKDIPPSFIALPFTPHNRGKTKEHIRHVINRTIHLHGNDAGAQTGIDMDLNSLIIHDVSIHRGHGGIEDKTKCVIPTEDEYTYLQEGDIINVTSPCYPEVVELANGINRVFIAPGGSRIQISFSEFRLELDGEYLHLGSEREPDVVGTFIARFTGYDLPPDMMSAGTGMWLRGWSYSQIVSGLFDAQITVIKDEMVDFECPADTEPCRYALMCYSEEEQCDGHTKCPSGTDEIGCVCYPPLSYFKCSDGRCLSRQYICNGPQGCSDDEAYCGFTCPSGKNVTDVFMCDGFNDCGDFADERQNCSCDQRDQWRCPDGTCIYKNNVCDGFPHCPGGDDEANCQCESWQFECSDGTCVPYWDRCDGNSTCADNSDEQNCPKCPGRLFQCASFQCLSQAVICDGKPDCFGGDDEHDCPPPAGCLAGEFSCGNGKCLRASLVCDRVPQCINGTDEENCDDGLDSCDFRCDNGECIPDDWICDGVEDCLEGEDEPDCQQVEPEPCDDGFFRCPDRQCIPDILICNGIRDCKGSTDEQNCTTNATDLCANFDENDYFVCDGKEDCPNGNDETNCPVCGKRPGNQRRRRMLAGRETTAAEWPWQIYLASQNDTEGVSCGGTVLNRQWIITAAHCISTFQIGRMVVITGLSSRLDFNDHGQLVHIADVYEHPDFYFSGYYLLYDVALVQLREPLTMTDYVRPICLPDSGFELEPGTYLTSTGFGETGAGAISTLLMETRLPVIPSEVCVRWTEHTLEDVSKVICVGYETGVQGPCYGDSGGPLVVEKDGSWYIVGIVSGGAECGAPYSPNFYTRVTELVHWIDDVINLR